LVASVSAGLRHLAAQFVFSAHRCASAAQRGLLDGIRSACFPVQIEGLRRMTPAEKLRMVGDLYHLGIRLRVAGLRLQHPDWPHERLEREARQSLMYVRT
jgi:hypothetical protein